MKVALVYDRVNKWGGAERVLLAFRRIFPNAHLFTSVYNKENASWASGFRKVYTTFLQNFPFAKSYHQMYAFLMPLAFESLNFDDYDLVISVTSESSKGIITKPKTRHICYCLTPTRYLWSGYDSYFRNPILRSLASPLVSYLKAWDKVASQRSDKYIAISSEVQKRIKKYYKRDSKVIYPPIALRSLRQFDVHPLGPKQRPYFLVVSRLVPYKRIDIAIKACNKLKLPLKVVGVGSQSLYLRLIAGSTIEFLGKVGDPELADLYTNCRALIFPGEEDFGLTMAEAQSFGKPVIAYKAGGAMEIVKSGKTGEFFDKPDSESLVSVLEKWDDKRYNRKSCIENSQEFSFNKFRTEILNVTKTI